MTVRADARNLPLADGVAHLAMWSPPYYAMREYGSSDGEIGQPRPVSEYVKEIVEAAHESLRCTVDDGSLFINVADRLMNRSRVRRSAHQPMLHGFADGETWAQAAARGGVITSSISGVRERSLSLVPERIALALYDSGLYVKSHIAWCKSFTTPDPEASDRAAIRHESVIQVSRSPRVRAFFPAGSTPSYVTLAPSTGRSGHPAPWPEALCEWIIERWSAPGDLVIDAFAGSGTTGAVAERMGRRAAMFDLYAGQWP